LHQAAEIPPFHLEYFEGWFTQQHAGIGTESAGVETGLGSLEPFHGFKIFPNAEREAVPAGAQEQHPQAARNMGVERFCSFSSYSAILFVSTRVVHNRTII
jgi:hypothetical protein